MSQLPIDVVPGTRPPLFRWKQRVTSPADGAERVVEHVGRMPPAAEGAVLELVALAKELRSQLEARVALNETLAERVAAQSELPSKKAEKATGGRAGK